MKLEGAPQSLSHAALVDRARQWLSGINSAFVVTEFVTAGCEIPDAMGWRCDTTFLVECKTSRSDFLADRAKSFRRWPSHGMGEFRYFMCEPGVIRPDDLPEKWGLLYVGAKRVTIEAGKNPRFWPGSDFERFHFGERNSGAETRILLSALRRLQLSLGAAEFKRLVHLPYSERKVEIAGAAA